MVALYPRRGNVVAGAEEDEDEAEGEEVEEDEARNRLILSWLLMDGDWSRYFDYFMDEFPVWLLDAPSDDDDDSLVDWLRE